MQCPLALTNQDYQSRLNLGVRDMPVSGSVHCEHVSGLPLISAILTATLVLEQVLAISAQFLSPQLLEDRSRAFQFSTIPHKGIWPDLTSTIIFYPKQEIYSIKTTQTSIRNTEFYGSLARNASFKTVYLHTFDQSRNYGRFARTDSSNYRTTDLRIPSFYEEFRDWDKLL